MPEQQKHLDQATHNVALYHHLDSATSPFVDWQITVLFYAALHYVDAYLANVNIHPATHVERNTWISRVSSLKPIYTLYQDLQNRSRDARYELYAIRQGYEQTLYKDNLVPIRDHIAAII